MRPAHRASRPRHLAGTVRTPWEPTEIEADFDVLAALDEDADFDFEALFEADDLEEAPKERVRVARHRIAFAVSVTIAAIPFLALDNFQATAESPNPVKVAATADAAKDTLRSVTTLPELLATTEVPPVSVDVTIAKATVYVGDSTSAVADTAPPTTAEPAPTTTTTEQPAPTTTTTVRATTTTAAPALAPAKPAGPDPADAATWERLAKCESGGNWQAVSEPRQGQQYYGGLQFSLATWQSLGGSGLPSDASKATQIEMGKKLQVRQGWGAWPTCARQFGWI